jgi:membrane protease YdiL (CAAX protease family)
VSTPFKPAGPTEHADYTPRDIAAPPPQVEAATPDNPPWGVLGGGGLWLASVVLVALCPAVFLIVYLMQQRVGVEDWARVAVSDPTAIFVQIVATIPAHLVTLGLAWLVVTRVGRRPFFRTLGWERGGLKLWHCAALAVGLLLLGYSILYLTGKPETQLDKILKSSRETAIATAFLATFTAPLVEEVVYRGALYSGLRKYLGAAGSGVLVVLLFALVHVPQYWPSYGTIAIILLLSAVITFVRAYSGQLLPCFVIHLFFNGIQSALIIAEPYLERLLPETPPAPVPDPSLILRLFGLV